MFIRRAWEAFRQLGTDWDVIDMQLGLNLSLLHQDYFYHTGV